MKIKIVSIFCLFTFCWLTCKVASAQQTPDAQIIGEQDQYVMDMTLDQRHYLWVATEDSGIWRYDIGKAPGQRWTQFDRSKGLVENSVLCVAYDRRGRIWAGHRNQGVSVWNGEHWQNYAPPFGPLGERVFDLEVSPQNGDVWMATNYGLTRYSVQKDEWANFTHANGLPLEAIQCLTFDQSGNVIAAMQRGGLAIGKTTGNFQKWETVSDKRVLASAGGATSGLFPTDLLTTRDGTIWMATSSGLARSNDRGYNWLWVRGHDFPTKQKDIAEYEDKGGFATGNRFRKLQGTKYLPAPLLREDYVTCLAQDAGGRLWLGYRRHGYEVRDAQTLQPLVVSEAPTGVGMGAWFVHRILPQPAGPPLIGYYGEGRGLALNNFHSVADPSPVPTGALTLPQPVSAPTLSQWNALLREAESVPFVRDHEQPTVTPLEDDWSTQGSWLGRYGRYWACLAAIRSPDDFVWGAGAEKVEYLARIGTNATPDDSIRYWVQWLATKTPESLEMPPTYFDSRVLKNYNTGDMTRRQAEWDDHGEEYELTKDGPHVYCSVKVPPGTFVLSLYNFNKDGKSGPNRWRDYGVSIWQRPIGSWLGDLNGLETWPLLAKSRIVDFRGGVWKRFLVQGPTELCIEMNRNYSFNTVWPGVMLDSLDEEPAPYFYSDDEWLDIQRTRESRWLSLWKNKNIKTTFVAARTEGEVIERLWRKLEDLKLMNASWFVAHARRFYAPLLLWHEQKAPRSTSAQKRERLQRLATSYYNLQMYARWEECRKQLGLVTTRQIEKALRWDGKTYDDAGRGHEIVSQWREAQSNQAKQKMP